MGLRKKKELGKDRPATKSKTAMTNKHGWPIDMVVTNNEEGLKQKD